MNGDLGYAGDVPEALHFPDLSGLVSVAHRRFVMGWPKDRIGPIVRADSGRLAVL